MIFEALVPLTLKTKTKGILELKSGERMDVPSKVILQLQEQIPDKIRVIGDEPKQLHPGVWIEFHSPLFGLCSAKILSAEIGSVWLTSHGVLKGADEPVKIPTGWIAGAYIEHSR